MLIDWENFDVTKPFTLPLESTCIFSIEYNPITFTLTIDFVEGQQYEYHYVPLFTVIELIRSGSAGRYFNATIRNYFDYKRLL